MQLYRTKLYSYFIPALCLGLYLYFIHEGKPAESRNVAVYLYSGLSSPPKFPSLQANMLGLKESSKTRCGWTSSSSRAQSSSLAFSEVFPW